MSYLPCSLLIQKKVGIYFSIEMYVYACLYGHMHMSVGACCDQKRELDPLKLRLQGTHEALCGCWEQTQVLCKSSKHS